MKLNVSKSVREQADMCQARILQRNRNFHPELIFSTNGVHYRDTYSNNIYKSTLSLHQSCIN